MIDPVASFLTTCELLESQFTYCEYLCQRQRSNRFRECHVMLIIRDIDDEAYNLSPLAAVYLGKLDMTHSGDIHGCMRKILHN